MSQQPQQQQQQQATQPDIQQVLSALHQAGFDQNVIDYIDNAIQQNPSTQQQITMLTTGLAQVQSALTTQQRTLSKVQQQQTPNPTTQKIKTDVKIEKPQKFDGTVKKFKDWLFNFEQYSKITGLDQQSNEQAQYAVTLFEKAAQTWWQVSLKSQPTTLDLSILKWNDLKSELETHFVDSDRERKLLNTFTSFVQIGDLSSYITNFRRVVLELGKLVSDEVVLWQFVKGLKPNLQKEVLKDPNLTVVSDAILIAERLDAAEKFSQNFSNYKNKNQQYKKQILNDHSTPMDIDTLYQMFQTNRGRSNQPNGRNNTQRGRNNSQRGFGRNARGNGRNSNITSQIECYYCHKKGHYARDCFQKQRDDANQQLYHMKQSQSYQNNGNNNSNIPPPPNINNNILPTQLPQPPKN